MKQRLFVDHIRVYGRAGDGGDGSVHFFRGKFNPLGGPDGGDGGRGGSVILEVAENTDNLTAFLFKSKLAAEDGHKGMGQKKTGRSGKDFIARVPPGTMVFRANADTGRVERPEEELELVADLTTAGDKFVLCQGGKGGKGNWHFKTPENRAPEEFKPGTPGEEGYYYFELRKIADAGLVGFPNAGKSTLLSRMSAARPKVASYPFTTLQPMIGVIEYSGYLRSTMADIPGLIEGAHANVGLGHDFLRHIRRCSVLLFVVDTAGIDVRDPIEDLEKLRKEVKLYDEELSKRQWMILANKMDLPESAENLKRLKTRFPKVEIIPISAQEETGLEVLKARLKELTAHRPE
jgi:GTP-binding protein